MVALRVVALRVVGQVQVARRAEEDGAVVGDEEASLVHLHARAVHAAVVAVGYARLELRALDARPHLQHVFDDCPPVPQVVGKQQRVILAVHVVRLDLLEHARQRPLRLVLLLQLPQLAPELQDLSLQRLLRVQRMPASALAPALLLSLRWTVVRRRRHGSFAGLRGLRRRLAAQLMRLEPLLQVCILASQPHDLLLQEGGWRCEAPHEQAEQQRRADEAGERARLRHI